MSKIDTLELPSGAVYDAEQLALMKRFHELGTVVWSDKPFTLKSQIESHVYVHARQELTQNTDVLKTVGQMISREIYLDALVDSDQRRCCLIGIPTAGTPLAAAAALFARDTAMAFKLMREKKKTHGANQLWVDGFPEPHHYRYCSVENVVTSGQSVEEADIHLAEDGYPVTEMMTYVLVDRQQGGIERLQKIGYKARALFALGDIAFAFGELGLWTKDQVFSVDKEIHAHRFL